MTTTVDNIEHIESQSLYGVAVVKVYFQPQVNIATAIAQVTAVSQTQLRQLPPGTTPPLVIDLQRIERADSAARPLRRGALRAAAQRLRPEFHPHAAGHHSTAPPFPIPTAASSARSRWISISRRCRPRAYRPADVVNAIADPESDPAFGHRQGRHVRVSARDQQRSDLDRRV